MTSATLVSPVPASPLLRLRRVAPGLLMSAAVALAALWLAGLPFFAGHGLGALTLAIVLGLV